MDQRDVIYQVLVDDGSGEGFVQREEYAYLAVLGGEVTLGSMPVAAPQFDTDEISWLQETSRHYSTGRLVFQDNGLSFYGAVTVGTSAADSQSFSVAGHASRSTVYDTKITTDKYAKGTDPSQVPANKWAKGRDVEVGYEVVLGSSDSAPKPKIRSKDKNGEWQEPGWLYDLKSEHFVLVVSTDNDTCSFLDDPGFYAAGELKFKASEPRPTGYGYISATCGGSTGDQVYLWTATPRPKTHAEGDGEVQPHWTPVDREAFFGGEEVRTESARLSVEELYLLVPSDALVDGKQESADLLNTPLARNMRWAMGRRDQEKEWATKLAGWSIPELSGEELKLAKAGEEWYRKWGKAYLTKSLNEYKGEGCSEVFLSKTQAEKLNCYFKVGIAKEPAFTGQYQGLYLETYIASKPKIRDYISDGGQKWAQALYEDATTSDQFIWLVNTYSNPSTRDGAIKGIKKNGTLLLALDTTGKYANKYYEAVTTGVVSKMIGDVTHYDAELAQSWIPDVITALLKQIADGKDPGTSGITKEQAAAMLEWFSKNKAVFTADLAAFLANIKASGLLDLARKAESGYAKSLGEKYPKMGKLGSLMFVAGWLGGLYSVMLALTTGDWKQLTAKQRADVITQVVSVGLDAFKTAKEVWAGVKKINLKVWQQLSKWFGSAGVKAVLSKIAETFTGVVKWLPKVGELFKKLLSAGSNIGKNTIFAKIFKEGLAVGALKLAGVAVSIALTVLALVDLIDCIKNHGTVTDVVLNSLAFAAALVGTACLVASLFVASAVIPIIGFVVALIGIVIAVVKWFTSKPLNPVTEFMRNHGIPFAESLPAVDDTCKNVPKATGNDTLVVAPA